MLATGGGPSEFWRPTWAVGPLDAPDRKIWSVRYERVQSPSERPVRPDVGAARSALVAAITDARDFARRVREDFWAAQFEAALQPHKTGEYHPDVVPATDPPEASELIAAASRAWVFGGMGTWNDLGFTSGPQQAEYTELSRLLFATVIQACVAAANCRLPAELT